MNEEENINFYNDFIKFYKFFVTDVSMVYAIEEAIRNEFRKYEEKVEKGIQKGIEKGIEKNKIQVVIKASEKGIAPEVISALTDMDVAEIERVILEYRSK